MARSQHAAIERVALSANSLKAITASARCPSLVSSILLWLMPWRRGQRPEVGGQRGVVEGAGEHRCQIRLQRFDRRDRLEVLAREFDGGFQDPGFVGTIETEDDGAGRGERAVIAD